MANNRVCYFSDISDFDENMKENRKNLMRQIPRLPHRKKKHLSHPDAVFGQLMKTRSSILLCSKNCLAEKKEMPKKY